MTNAGINALDLIGSKASSYEIMKAEELLKLNYGVDYSKEKFTMLWEMIVEEGWTNERLKATVKWFLKNKKYATWTIADWFEYSVKLYPYSWYLDQIQQFGGSVNQQIEKYKVNGIVLYRYNDGSRLPFEYLGLVETPKKKDTKQNGNVDPDKWKGMFCDFTIGNQGDRDE